jgi:hypothetical protein
LTSNSVSLQYKLSTAGCVESFFYALSAIVSTSLYGLSIILESVLVCLPLEKLSFEKMRRAEKDEEIDRRELIMQNIYCVQ